MNAHINYDLALTVADAGTDPDRTRKHADHRAIDDILARVLDAQPAALAEVYAAGVADVVAAFGRLEESLTLRSMVEAREWAWRIAVVLTDVGVAPVGAAVRWLHRATATGGAFFVLGPRLDPSTRRALHDVEAWGFDLREVLARVDDHLQRSR